MSDFLTSIDFLVVITFGTSIRFIPWILRDYKGRFFTKRHEPIRLKKMIILYALILVGFHFFLYKGIAPEKMVGMHLIWVSFLGTTILDRNFHVIPDRFHLIGILGTVLFHLFSWQTLMQNFIISLITTVVLLSTGKIYHATTQKTPMGQGDVKLIAWLTLLAGEYFFILFPVTSFMVILNESITLHTKKKGPNFAFGPSLCLIGLLYLYIYRFNAII